MLKLYKQEKGIIFYWEAWEDEDEITVHWGELGQTGEIISIPLNEFEPPEAAIKKEAEKPYSQGFIEVKQEDLYELIIQYPVEGMGVPEDIETAYQLEELMNDCLGWTGNGYCDSNDLGEGTMNIYCYVVNPKLALKPILEELTANERLDNAVIAYQDKDESFVVLWPLNYDKPFNY
jgi:predicted DNA-binding WGR domain protein